MMNTQLCHLHPVLIVAGLKVQENHGSQRIGTVVRRHDKHRVRGVDVFFGGQYTVWLPLTYLEKAE